MFVLKLNKGCPYHKVWEACNFLVAAVRGCHFNYLLSSYALFLGLKRLSSSINDLPSNYMLLPTVKVCGQVYSALYSIYLNKYMLGTRLYLYLYHYRNYYICRKAVYINGARTFCYRQTGWIRQNGIWTIYCVLCGSQRDIQVMCIMFVGN